MTPLDVIKDHYAASARGDLPGMLACLTPNVQWTEMAGFPYAGTYTGPEGVSANVFQRIGAEWDGYQAVPDGFVAAGDEVVAFGVYSGAYKQTGKHFEARFVHHWRFAGDKVVRFEQYTDTALVAAAMR